MPEYHFTGRLTLSGVDFYISAPTKEEAIERAKAGKYDEVDELNSGEVVDCEINPKSVKENS